uniref:Protein SHQ1 homolog n=1 Tax=Meloidogyne hapla TaxID=6305 RepID=A0A1I8B193_MELHA
MVRILLEPYIFLNPIMKTDDSSEVYCEDEEATDDDKMEEDEKTVQSIPSK